MPVTRLKAVPEKKRSAERVIDEIESGVDTDCSTDTMVLLG